MQTHQQMTEHFTKVKDLDSKAFVGIPYTSIVEPLEYSSG